MSRCRWCNKEIEYMETPIDNFWYHVDAHRMKCGENQPTLAEPLGRLENRHRFKIVGKYRDPLPFHTLASSDGFAYFVVYRCRGCGSVWKVERSWLWEGKMAFDPKDWSACKGSTE